MNSESPDKSAKGFLDAGVDSFRYDGHTNDSFEVAGIISSFVPKGSRVLDVGCGTGSVSRIVVDERHAEFLGIEPDEQRAHLARARGLEVINGYLTEEIYTERGQFDVILFADVLEHMPDPGEVIRLARRGLRNKGAVIISVPNIAHWSIRFDLARGRFDYQPTGIMDATHLRWFTEKSLRLLLHSEGFKIDGIRRSAGVTLPCYTSRRPWLWMPIRLRIAIIRKLALKWPRLFGCQHIVRATPMVKSEN